MPVRTSTKPKVKTLDEAVLYMTDSIAEMSKKMAETDAKIAKSDAKIAESDAKIAESQAKTDSAIQRLSDKIDESIKKTQKEIESLSREVKLVNSGLGTIGERFGKLVEFIVIPGIRPEMEKLGHKFRYATANKKFKYMAAGKIEKKMEIDLLLRNGEKTMAVEIKTTLSTGDVDGHLEKLKKMRKYETATNIKGKKLYGAMVGVFVDVYAREYAYKNGLYIIEILEQEQKLEISPPAKTRIW